jgi:hypothetical protein
MLRSCKKIAKIKLTNPRLCLVNASDRYYTIRKDTVVGEANSSWAKTSWYSPITSPMPLYGHWLTVYQLYPLITLTMA